MSSATGRRRGPDCGPAAGRSSTPTRTIPISTTPRPSALALDRFDGGRAIATAIDRAAEWIIGMQSRNGGWGVVRRRQHALLPEPHPVRRSRRAARSADRRCQRPLRRLPGAARRWRPTIRRWRAALDYLRREQEADGSWFGRWGTNYIYGTWSVLCALNAAGVDADDADSAARRRLAAVASARRRRLGRRRRELLAGRTARRGAVQHAVADRLGAARPDGGGRGRPPGGGARHRLSDRDARTTTATGTSRGTRRSVSRACSTCATTATGRSSRSGRWPATAACRSPTRARSRSGCETVARRPNPDASRIARRRRICNTRQSSRPSGCGLFPAFARLDYGCAGMGQHFAARLCGPIGRDVRARAGPSRLRERD